jgi:hypothetical protein
VIGVIIAAALVLAEIAGIAYVMIFSSEREIEGMATDEREHQITSTIELLPQCQTDDQRYSLLITLKLANLQEIARRLGIMPHGNKTELARRIATSRRASNGAET